VAARPARTDRRLMALAVFMEGLRAMGGIEALLFGER
jgi:hypothetical protein